VSAVHLCLVVGYRIIGMPNKCAAYGCKSGYSKTEVQTDEQVSFHAFPLSNKELCDKWIRANPRKDYVPSKHSKLCSLHFKPTDFVEVRRDTNKQRMKGYADNQLVRRYLKDDVVPSVFSNLPSYLTSTQRTPRSSVRATASSRRHQEMKQFENLEETFMAEDNISQLDLNEVHDKLRSETAIPSGFTVTSISPAALLIYILAVTDDIPRIKANITVRDDFTVAV